VQFLKAQDSIQSAYTADGLSRLTVEEGAFLVAVNCGGASCRGATGFPGTV
jgi:hypothetical protein